MRKNKVMRLASAMLILTLITTCAISGTFAKYTSETTSEDTARVAKWEFTVDDDVEGAVGTQSEGTFGLDLFTHADSNTMATDEDGNKLVAPGTEGEVVLTITNNSEVTAEYAVDYTVNNAGVPLEYSVDNGTTWTTTLSNVTASADTKLASKGGQDTITIKWRWAFNGADSTNYTTAQTDATDTTLGIAGSATPTVTATVTVTQVD